MQGSSAIEPAPQGVSVDDLLAGRSQRGAFAWIAYQMFYHREHHLFPKVPVSRLQDLARRLDAGVPGYASARRPVLAIGDPVPAAALRTPDGV